ncbi:MBL fold metallo-hydrolase [uncultured Piscinibacter sp.]|uniref:MBL fold metallo-hydrolase n=1 Tax=uncultured Piscinibacter sp. TaxID=1131835 RepID=UPI0026263730|nr:MBL fold metallo-hydrolase [uncultured Piscinibacter sp.]
MSNAASVHEHPALAGLRVFERGWLSSNNILVSAAEGEEGATLIDTGHVNHAAQTLSLLRHALGDAPLARIVNTHLHSDHCGGNAALARAFGARIIIPPGLAAAARAWAADALSYEATGQRCERFEVHATLSAAEVLEAGGRRFEAIAAPGHDPHSVMLFDAANGLLISADALWENGFGVVFPEMEGEPGFADVAAVLDAIGRLPVRLVVPGHGAPFTDVEAALGRARSRLASFLAEPARHARHGVKVLIKYHLMEVREQHEDDLLRWAAATPLFTGVWHRHGRAQADSPEGWCAALVNELVGSGALRRRAGVVSDAG